MCWRRPSSKTADPIGAVRVCQAKGVFMGSVLVREGLKGSAKACAEAGCGSLDRCLGSGAGERVDTVARLPVSGGARGGTRQGRREHAQGGRAGCEEGHAPERVGFEGDLDAVVKKGEEDMGVDDAPVC